MYYLPVQGIVGVIGRRGDQNDLIGLAVSETNVPKSRSLLIRREAGSVGFGRRPGHDDDMLVLDYFLGSERR